VDQSTGSSHPSWYTVGLREVVKGLPLPLFTELPRRVVFSETPIQHSVTVTDLLEITVNRDNLPAESASSSLGAFDLFQQRTSRGLPISPYGSGSPAQQTSTHVAAFHSERHYGNHAQEPVPAPLLRVLFLLPRYSMVVLSSLVPFATAGRSKHQPGRAPPPREG
jgi:hypothetical protein